MIVLTIVRLSRTTTSVRTVEVHRARVFAKLGVRSRAELTAPALADLLALPNSRFALQFGDADLATQIAAGVGAPLTVPTLAPSTSAP